ncbi:MAG: SDR family oxidoreductase [Pseudomonadota bacterium]
MMTSMLFDLSGRVALVTGAGSGIGRAMAQALADAGAAVVLVGRRAGALAESLGDRRGATVPIDITLPAAPNALRDACFEIDLVPDVLVNAAGVNRREPADLVTEEGWDETIALNLTAPFRVAQALVPAMRERGWGRIINIASLQSERAFANGIAYGASKAGVAQLTRAMAEAWSRDGINANALAPGFFPTDLTAPVFDDPGHAARNAAQTAIGRNGEMADLTGPTVFLASEASRYVTGQLLYVDGGFTAK